ncbi:unnamed protein product [Didymodactylos carnosus]|uniref:AI-2E family transporter n=1 Tax=Didymodactylos carnosus TaxID=1234261 RepID=A0A815JP46_9BILA|nr:unnamed protein product [Didymodactylos carnosus]CAF1381623.1 unnamed protein product [Didymodactylos carnosus]CAF4043082.1 unnamed protein product [Didymodactylos carnosus]CAF4276809.1 unnamed protein product [Didymodactylos carnosus]
MSTCIIIWRYLAILILAVWLSTICRPLLELLVNHLPLVNRCREKRSRSAVAATLIVFVVLLLIIPIIVLCIVLSSSTMDLVKNLSNSTTVRSAINLIVPPNEQKSNTSLLDFTKKTTNTTTFIQRLLLEKETITDFLQLFGIKALSILSTLAGAIAQFVIGILIFLVSTYTFLLHGVDLWEWIIHHSPLSMKHMNRLKQAFHETGRGLLIGVFLTCLAQGVVAAITYLCLRISRWYALGLLTGLCSLIPIVGTGLVWIPITIGLFLQAQYTRGTILIVVGILGIGSIDNLLRPLFSKMGSLQMSTLVLLLTIFGGLELLGPWGALLGPLIVRLATETLVLVREDEDEQEQSIEN